MAYKDPEAYKQWAANNRDKLKANYQKWAAKEGNKEKLRRYRERHKGSIVAKQTEWRREHPDEVQNIYDRYFEKRRAFFNWLKSAPCIDCGQCFPPECMDFDHITGTKMANVGQLLYCSPSRIQKELVHCELVCANCHRTRTVRRRKEVVLALVKEVS